MLVISMLRSNPMSFFKSLLRAAFTAINRSLTVFSAYKVVGEEGIDTADRILMPATFAVGVFSYFKNKTIAPILRTVLSSISRAISTANVKHIIMLAIRERDWKRFSMVVVSYVFNTYVYHEPPHKNQKNESMRIIQNFLAANLTAMARMVTIDSLYLLITSGDLDVLDLGLFLGTLFLSGMSSYQTGNVYKSTMRASMTACNRGFSIVLLHHVLPALIEKKDKWLLILMAATFSMSLPVYFDNLPPIAEQRISDPSTNSMNTLKEDIENPDKREQEYHQSGEQQPLLVN